MKPRHVIYTVLATLVIFAAGVITGGTLVRRTNVVKPPQPQPAQGFQMHRLNQFQQAVNRMELEPEQRQRVNRLIRERQDYIAELMRIIEPDLPGVFIRLHRDVKQELRPEQRLVLDGMWAQVEQKKFQNRNPEFMGRPGEGVIGRPERPFNASGDPLPPIRPRPARQFPDRPPPGEPQQQNPPPQQ